jgi:hypothetical protein
MGKWLLLKCKNKFFEGIEILNKFSGIAYYSYKMFIFITFNDNLSPLKVVFQGDV